MVRSALGPFHVEAQDELVEIGGSRYRVHPAGAVFPVMSGREFDELVEDVPVNVLRKPVVVSGGQPIDGRNRVRACAAADVVQEVPRAAARDRRGVGGEG